MLPNEKFKAEQVMKDGKRTVILRGNIDEDTNFDDIKKIKGPIVFNFKEVTSINSLGVRNWVNFLKEMVNDAIYFDECPPTIVRQMNMVPSFVGTARVLSVFVPYVCDECEHEKLVMVDEKNFKAEPINVAESIECDSCGKGEMELDGHPQQYFAFAK